MPPSTDTATPADRHTTWIQGLAESLACTDTSVESRVQTIISCDMKSNRHCLFLPPDMAELQPRSLRYLHAFAKAHELRLVEDRRRVDIRPIIEHRDRKPPMIALALSLLLQQTGLPGLPRSLSRPHRLNADSPHIGIAQLIRMSACAAPASKRVVVLPPRMMVNVLNNDTQPITGHACKLVSAEATTILSHFESSSFRAVGYSAGSQYVMHVFLAGGPLESPALWTYPQTLTRTDFRFQLFPGRKAKNDFGLLHATFYFDIASSPSPWWRQEAAGESFGLSLDDASSDGRKLPPIELQADSGSA